MVALTMRPDLGVAVPARLPHDPSAGLAPSEGRRSWRDRVLTGGILACMLATFVVDMITPADDVSLCFVYTVPIAFGILGPPRRLYAYAALAGLLSVAGSFVQPPTTELLSVFLGNRAIAIASQWMVAALVASFLTAQARTLAELAAEQRKVEAGQRFLSILSHEIGTSLTVIDGQAFRLARLAGAIAPADLAHRATRIRRAVDRIRDLAERIQLASDAGDGNITPHADPVELVGLLEEAIQHTTGGAEDRRIRLVSGSPLGVTIHGDRQMLSHVFDNLLSNAVRYSPPGAAVEVECHESGGVATVSVRDGGPGVPTEEHGQLFEPYVRGQNSRGTPGLGIGLFIARRFVIAHGGRIFVDPRVTDGARLVVELPA